MQPRAAQERISVDEDQALLGIASTLIAFWPLWMALGKLSVHGLEYLRGI